jgi:hypothetical protein
MGAFYASLDKYTLHDIVTGRNRGKIVDILFPTALPKKTGGL